MPRPLFTPGKDPVPIVQEAGWAPGPVWTGAENLDPTRIRLPDRPARSQSLYRLSYPAHCKQLTLLIFVVTEAIYVNNVNMNCCSNELIPMLRHIPAHLHTLQVRKLLAQLTH